MDKYKEKLEEIGNRNMVLGLCDALCFLGFLFIVTYIY